MKYLTNLIMLMMITSNSACQESGLKTLRYQFKKLTYGMYIVQNLYYDNILHLPTEYKELPMVILLLKDMNFLKIILLRLLNISV